MGEGGAVRIVEVSKDFPAPGDSQVRIPALRNVSLNLAAGELVSLIGPSGCGKSTLLRLAAGLETPARGELWVGSEQITGPGAERGLVFQDPNLFPWLTVRGNVQAGLVARGVFDQNRDEVDEFLRLVGLDQFANAFPHHLSGGMAQRAALARALINHPKVLLLDEPLGALDAFTRMRMQDEVLRLWQSRRTTILLVTHDIDEAIYMSDRIVVLSPRPGSIERNIDVPMDRPRDRNSTEFLRLRGDILEHLHFAGQAGNSVQYSVSSIQSGKGTGDERMEAAGKPGVASASPGQVESPKQSSHLPPRTSHLDNELDADVLIIGGGPAGSTVGAYLATAGIDHIILDRAVHPRAHVGESLVCSTTRIFQEIDFLPVMEREQFVHKHGAVWTHWAAEKEHVIRFRDIPELGVTQDYTYHVDRGRFDELMLHHAAKRGSRVLQGARVERVEFDANGAATGAQIRHEGRQRSVRCKLLVDASGRSTIIGSQLRIKHHDALFDQFAVHNWFEGVDRGPAETAEFIHIHVLSMPRAWIWLIPINESTTSVGIVTKALDFPRGRETPDNFFARHIASHPLLSKRLSRARALHQYTREGNYSYSMERFTGDGWLLVGDAARFIDPVFSSGVSVAMESGKRAAKAIVDALKTGNVSASAFDEYEGTVRNGVDIWREFIVMYYQLPPLFFDIISRPEGLRQITQLLQGDVYDRARVPVLDEMRAAIRTVASDAAHPWHAELSEELSLT
jgi:ABC-type nitrate/sulfonate/bicarbonate transport system ATPase subunit/flavin-dependent dehydrogenase